MRVRPEYLVLWALLLGGAAACVNDPNRESYNDPSLEAARLPREDAALIYPTQPTPIYLSHPWVGRQVRLRDYTGDSYDRCLGPKVLPAQNVELQAQLCYPSGLDALQWFEVVGLGISSGIAINRDPMQVTLRSVYNPSLCVDVAWGTANGGEVIQLFPCQYSPNQRLHLPVPATTTATTATGRVLTKNSSYTMAFEADPANSSGTVKPVYQRLVSNAVLQQWTVQVR